MTDTSTLKVTVIGQDNGRAWAEMTLLDMPRQAEIDIEVAYPDGETVRYSRQID